MSCRPGPGPEAEFNRASMLFQHGQLQQSQELCAHLADAFNKSDPRWAARFRILEGESAAWRERDEELLSIVSPPLPAGSDSEMTIHRLALLGRAHSHLHQYQEADSALLQADRLCSNTEVVTCGGLLLARGGLALERGQLELGRQYFSQELSLARKFSQRMDEATALMNLGYDSLLRDRIDEAISWSQASNSIANQLSARDILVSNQGNLGWAYYELGDNEKALEMFKEAEEGAVALGDSGEAIDWITDLGHVYESTDNPALALQAHLKALEFANQINSKARIITALEDLAQVSIQAGKFDDAKRYVDQVTPLLQVNKNRIDALDIELAEGEIAAGRREDQQAEERFRTVERDSASQTWMRLDAEHQLARLYEVEGRPVEAESMYKEALATFEGARDQLRNEDTTFSFFANATRIYDDYIHFLVEQGKTEEALITADQSRARTLSQGLGVAMKKGSFHPVSISPRAVARKAGATLLFYWLGTRQSYLWAITPEKTELFTLPAQKEITPLLDGYRKALLNPGDPLITASSTGQELYHMLVAPAAKLIRPGVPVMILADGPLSLLNFETLMVPAANSTDNAGQAPHYWIEDATLIAGPSLAMVAAAKTERGTAVNAEVKAGSVARGKLLLIGNPVSPNENYPELRYAAQEMTQIGKHFASADEVVFRRKEATPAAYLTSSPRQFSYIHFVSHGVASRTDPLDSAIILSKADPTKRDPRSQAGAKGPAGEDDQDSFKLYAREVMRHPIDARLVTISACYGSGIRAYAGEGLVGLSWAFLRAGAHNVIGALWEASDDSTAQLMDGMYEGLHDGRSPDAALRSAKLALLHSQSSFRKPFYWAPFQIYTGL